MFEISESEQVRRLVEKLQEATAQRDYYADEHAHSVMVEVELQGRIQKLELERDEARAERDTANAAASFQRTRL